MFVFDHPWVFAVLPFPLLMWWLLPPYREVSHAIRIPFFEEAARAGGLTPARGAVVLKTNWIQKIGAPVAWVLVVLAAASPQWVDPPIERVESARDLILAIDISQSMETRDFVDSQGRRADRLTAVKGVVDEFIDRRRGDRIGLIVFGTAAFPQAPLTMDHATVRLLLDEVKIGMAGPQTSIGDAIGVAIKMTEHSKTKERVLILLTDGNDTASKLPPGQAAKIAAQHAMTIHTIGIGNPQANGEQRVDLKALEQIARVAGGRSFRGENRQELEGIYKTIDEMTPELVKRALYRPKRALYMYPLGAATLLLLGYHVLMLVWTSLARHREAVQPTPTMAARTSL
ncbi:membrane protein [Nitrospira sp. KM1]|uniref:vWA domain-containing protein n=1 Tax=Nitrospira sp. KM1 TaxID=1936990 RepID=UPI0013A72037|nr:VWA domain-containing protein [Nitrospira sp. KM1]BCA54623.1 membrane protein [Nitrospira sp. KM1]